MTPTLIWEESSLLQPQIPTRQVAYPRGFLVYNWMFAILLVGIVRYLLAHLFIFFQAHNFGRNRVLVACSTAMTVNGTEHSGDVPSANWTRFNLPSTNNSAAHIVIKENSCG